MTDRTGNRLPDLSQLGRMAEHFEALDAPRRGSRRAFAAHLLTALLASLLTAALIAVAGLIGDAP